MSAYTAMRRKDTSATSLACFARNEIQLHDPAAMFTAVEKHGNVAQVYFRKGNYDYRLTVERLSYMEGDAVGHAWGEPL